MLSDAGPSEKPLEVFASDTANYLNNQETISVQALKKNVVVSKSIVHHRSRKVTPGRENDPQSWSKIYSTRSLMHRRNIKELIKQGNLAALEDIVVQGFGDRLIGEMSTAPLVQDFLDNVPSLIEQITELHKAAVKGNLDEFRGLVDRKDLVLARDQIGATPLHKAVLYKHQELVEYIASNFPASLDARDHDGRTALHYAAALQDDRMLYNILVKAGASPLLPDNKGRSPKYYLRFPDQINTQHIIKRSQRLNTNYAINTANRIKSKSPCRKRGWSPNNRKSDRGAGGSRSDPGLSDDQEGGDVDDASSNESAGSASNPFSKLNLRSRPNILPPSSVLKRYEVTSANLKRWIEEQDLESLEGAILEGHGDRVRTKVETLAVQNDTSSVQSYLEETFPKVMNKIRMIHAAVSCGDLTGLQDYLDKNDYALAKDHLGMAPLHKAVILGHIDVVEFILERFPETVNARDREGRSALHYAAATTNKNGSKIYKILLRGGADPRIRDNNGKTAEYYRVHLLTLPTELSKLTVNSKRKPPIKGGPSPIFKRRQFLLPSVQEKITNALHDGDAAQLQELVLEGYGDAIIGRSSWGEDARKFLKNLPHLMDNIKSLQSSISNGDLNNVERILDIDSNLLRAKDENGLMAIHLATFKNQEEIASYLIEKHPNIVNWKDQFGRTPLHIAAQNNFTDLYKKLVDAGGDPMTLDSRGRSAEYYVKYSGNAESPPRQINSHPRVEKRKIQTNGVGSEKEVPVNGEVQQINEETVCDKDEPSNDLSPEEKTVENEKDESKTEKEAPVASAENTESNETNAEYNDDFEAETVEEAPAEKEVEESRVESNSSAESKEITSHETQNGEDGHANPLSADTEEAPQKEITDTDLTHETNAVEGESSPVEEDRNTNAVNELETEDGTETKITSPEKKPAVESPVKKAVKKTPARRQISVATPSESKRATEQRKASLPLMNDERSKTRTTKVNERNNLRSKRASVSGSIGAKTVNGKLVRSNTETIQAIGSSVRKASKGQIKEESIETNEPENTKITGSAEQIEKEAAKAGEEHLNESSQEDPSAESQKTEVVEANTEDNQVIENSNKDNDTPEETNATEISEGAEVANLNGSEPVETPSSKEEAAEKENHPVSDENQITNQKTDESTDSANVDVNDLKDDNPPEHTSEAVAGQQSEEIKPPPETHEANEDQNIEKTDQATNLPTEVQLPEEKAVTPTQEENETAPKSANVIQPPPTAGNENGEESVKIEGNLETNEEKSANRDSKEEVTENVDKVPDTNEVGDGKEAEANQNDQLVTEKGMADKAEQPETEGNELSEATSNAGNIVDEAQELSLNQAASQQENHSASEEGGANAEDDAKSVIEEEAKTVAEEEGKTVPEEEQNVAAEEAEKVNADNRNVEETELSSVKEKESSSEEQQVEAIQQEEEVSGVEGRTSGELSRSPVNSDDRLNELIDQWLDEGDLLRLEHVVIAGQGERLIGKKSENKQVQEFLDLVPAYMAKISHVHETVVRGNFNEVRQILTRKRFALSRDHLGASPLHLAVLHGHMDVLVYIITQFPETIDGPDNEGRTALHYAAVVGEEDIQYYEILKKSGANENLIDKLGHPPNFYLKNPGVLTIRDLLQNYKQDTVPGKPDEDKSVDVWKRPPTADIESQLTPSSSGSPTNRPNSVDSEGKRDSKSKTSYHREVSADVHVDANADTEPVDPKEEAEVKEEIESLSLQFEEALKQEKDRLQENFDKVMESASNKGPESLAGDSISSESSDSTVNLWQVKDENGQTVLHLAASRPQRKGVLYKMLAQAEYLIPERDVKYRTLRDVAIDKQLKENVTAIDEFVIDAFVRRNVAFVQNLAHEGYDLVNVVDANGNDATAILRKRNIKSMLNLLQDISYFQKSRAELHTFIKNDYLEGVQGVLQTDPTLITAKNRRGRCALHIAVLFQNLDIIECLIKADPSAVNTQDNLGRTPLHYAMANSKVEEIGLLLITAGANRTIRDVRMRTPSYYFVYPDEIREIKREEQALE